MDLDRLERKLKAGGGLGELANTPESRALGAQFDASELRDAAAKGDAAALQDILRRILSTSEGRALGGELPLSVNLTRVLSWAMWTL